MWWQDIAELHTYGCQTIFHPLNECHTACWGWSPGLAVAAIVTCIKWYNLHKQLSHESACHQGVCQKADLVDACSSSVLPRLQLWCNVLTHMLSSMCGEGKEEGVFEEGVGMPVACRSYAKFLVLRISLNLELLECITFLPQLSSNPPLWRVNLAEKSRRLMSCCMVCWMTPRTAGMVYFH